MKKLPILLFAVSAAVFSCDKNQNQETAVKQERKKEVEKEVRGDVKPQENTADNSGKPALNPPHGEPHHRCDIEVGAPLNSPAPVQNPAPVAMPKQAPVNNNFNTNPITPSASAQNNGVKPALNPPHGEPHHRCDLEVGAPLI